jgi:hypothetical protein
MTMTVDIGKFKTKLKHQSCFGYREREVEFDVTWVSCGVYQLSYYRPRDAKNHEVIVEEDWYPPDTAISFTPEQFEMVAKLYPQAPKRPRNECYKPFYENYDLDRGMFDFGNDELFQAFKDPTPDVERVYLVNRHFTYGSPSTSTQVLGLYIEDFKRLQELINSKKGEIFYSGCKVAMPSKCLTDIADALKGE